MQAKFYFFNLVSIGIIIMYGKKTLNRTLRKQNAKISSGFNELRKTQSEEFSVSVAVKKFLDQLGSYKLRINCYAP
jgi:hypothetical protein